MIYIQFYNFKIVYKSKKLNYGKKSNVLKLWFYIVVVILDYLKII